MLILLTVADKRTSAALQRTTLSWKLEASHKIVSFEL